jgi:hypothetical protein
VQTAIPAQGVRGAAEIRLQEAGSTEFRQVIGLVEAAAQRWWREKLGKPSDSYIDCYIESIFPDTVVVRHQGRYWQHSWSLNADNQVQLSEPVEVVEQYMPVRMREAAETFVEALDAAGKEWDVVVIRAGLSKNGVYYPDAVLREAAALFEGARVFAKADAEHVRGEGKDINKLVGWLDRVKFVEGAAHDAGRIAGRLNLSAAAEKLRVFLADAWQRGKRDIAGLSIDAEGQATVTLREGRKVRQAQSITKVHSVDVIVDPSAGGEFVRLVESVEETEQMRDKLIAAIKANPATAAKYPEPDKLGDEQLEAAYREAVQPSPTAPAGAVTPEDLRIVEARIAARVKIAHCGLPAPAVARVSAAFEQLRFTEAAKVGAEVDRLIASERDYLAQFSASGHVQLPFGSVDVEDRRKKVDDMLDAFFDPRHKDHGRHMSFKECYIEITGDRRITGQLDAVDRSRFAESTGSMQFREALDGAALANVLGAALRRAMLREYRAAVDFDAWRRCVSVVPIADFRTNERTRLGGYSDLPTVGESAPYPELASPTDEKATYAVAKRGGLESITLEQIRNDDAGVIGRIPIKLGRSAKRTLAKFVFDFFRTNPTIYDGIAFFHASHNNLFTAALDATQLASHRLAMLKQTELSSADRVGIGPRILLAPVDLQETAVNLFNRNTNNDKTFIQSMTMDIIPVWYWTDANDWVTLADPMDIPTIEIGFLDGAEEPQMFVQDNPTVGSMFSNDKLTWKIRHIYGGNVTDFRGATKAVVP